MFKSYAAILLCSLSLFALSWTNAQARSSFNVTIVTPTIVQERPMVRVGHWQCVNYQPWDGMCVEEVWMPASYYARPVYYAEPVYYYSSYHAHRHYRHF